VVKGTKSLAFRRTPPDTDTAHIEKSSIFNAITTVKTFKADFELQVNAGATPLMTASDKENAEVEKLLLDK
jgi:hypothetical protein